MNRAQKLEYAQLLEEQIRRNKLSKGLRNYEYLYDWQLRFNAATANYTACLLMAANQVGKSLTGCVIDAFHLTGDYPEGWEGHKFKKPPMCWLLGYSGEKTRDLLQLKLFGRFVGGKFEGGLVQADKILDHRSMTGTSGAMREVRVKHENGTATCQFWSYSQGQSALMGDVVDWYHIDEEPKDGEIYPQVITRTLNGDNGAGGRGILTFTPENGKTELVCRFMDEPGLSMYLQTATWDDAYHLTEETKESILSQYPAYQRDMRSKGTPLMGAGLIYEHSEGSIKCEPFEIPAHWYLINGMDFGWDHPQAHIQMAWDMGADTFYIIHAFKKSKIQPFEAWHIVRGWSEDIPTAWPADGLQTEKGSAKQQKDYYEEAGFEMCDEHATWEEGGVGVEAGLMELNNLMKTGRFKVFSHLIDVFEEVRQYHRVSRPNGKSEIVKVKEDLLDACFVGETEVITRNGLERIDSLVGTVGEVLSISGEWRNYNHCRLTRKKAELITITFSDGHEVTCTPDHRFLTCNGWKEAVHLHDESIIMAGDKCLIQSCLTGSNSQGSTTITGLLGVGYIERYGRTITDKYRIGAIYTILTSTLKITVLKISNALRPKSIINCISKAGRNLASFAASATASLIVSCHSQRFAVTNANLNSGANPAQTTNKEYALDVMKHTAQTSIKNADIAAEVAKEKIGFQQARAGNTLKISQIRSAKRNDVYCMEVDDTHAFALANGVITHNCRYAYMMRRHAIQKNDIGRDYEDEDDHYGNDTNAMGY